MKAELCHQLQHSHIRAAGEGGGRKVILPSLLALHDFFQRECNISILVSVSSCMFAVLHLRVEPHAAKA